MYTTPNHLYNVIKLEYIQYGVSWWKKQWTEDDSAVTHQNEPSHALIFFYLSESCSINPDLLGLKNCWFLKGKKKKGKKERKRERKRKGRQIVENTEKKRKGWKGEREPCWVISDTSLSLDCSEETQTQMQSNLSHPPWWLNLLAAAYKIVAGCLLITPGLLSFPWKRKHHRTKLNTSLWFLYYP